MKSRAPGIASDRRFVLALLASIALLLFGACGVMDEQPVQVSVPQCLENAGSARYDIGDALSTQLPDQSTEGAFYPLAIGNHWTYSGETSFLLDGRPIYAAHVREGRTLIGTEVLSGQEYIVEEQVETQDSNPRIWTTWIRYRQDRTGLYEADVPTTQPPGGRLLARSEIRSDGDALEARTMALRERLLVAANPQLHAAYAEACDRLLKKLEAVNAVLRTSMPGARAQAGPPGGIMWNEITRLRYPLHPGQSWAIREVPFFGATVEKHEVLDLAAGRINGYRISITNGLSSPDDVVLTWYGRDGFLGMSVHVVAVMTDPGGNPIGTLVADEQLFLDSLELGRGRWQTEPTAREGSN